MGKKSRSALANEIDSVSRYRWEFVRRNTEYQKNVHKFLFAVKKIHLKTKNNQKVFNDKYEKLYAKTMKKYDIPPLDYRRSYNEYLAFSKEVQYKMLEDKSPLDNIFLLQDTYSEKFTVQIASYSEEKLRYILLKKNPVYKKNINIKETLKKAKTLQLSINLDYPKDQVLKKVAMFIDESRKARRKYKRSRKRLPQYDDYLKIYDLKKAGWSWKKLAKRFYRGDDERGEIGYAIRKVRRDYNRCVKLINGGYVHIR